MINVHCVYWYIKNLPSITRFCGRPATHSTRGPDTDGCQNWRPVATSRTADNVNIRCPLRPGGYWSWIRGWWWNTAPSPQPGAGHTVHPYIQQGNVYRLIGDWIDHLCQWWHVVCWYIIKLEMQALNAQISWVQYYLAVYLINVCLHITV